MEKCCVFSKKLSKDCLQYEIIKKYDWKEELVYKESYREFVKCKECNSFFIHQLTNFDGSIVQKFIQVEDEAEADSINNSENAISFSNIEKPCIDTYKDSWYFSNLEPKKELTREEQIAEINKMTFEEKMEEWGYLYEIYSDFENFSSYTDIIEMVISVLEDILSLSEETGGMEESYKEKYENLIKEYKKRLTECEIKEKETYDIHKKEYDEANSELDSLLEEFKKFQNEFENT